MPISQTTFDQRIARIEKAQRITAVRKAPTLSFGARLLSLPCLTGIGILTGFTGYAWANTQPAVHVNLPDVAWLISLVS